MRKILYSVARTGAGELVRAVDAEKGAEYFCGFCKDPLVLKKSGNTGMGSKRPHFAHRVLTPNCSPETGLHFEFKTMLAEEIRRRIAGQKEMRIGWRCAFCRGEHSGNLLKKARRVELEFPLGPCRPDVVLFDEAGRAFAAIEIVVTHRPEEAVREHFQNSGTTLVELHLTSEDVLTDVAAKLGNADLVNLCPDRVRCKKCRNYQIPVVMKTFWTKCLRCQGSILVPYIEGDHSRGERIGPELFSDEELEIARRIGASIRWQYSKSLDESYWASTCGRCERFIEFTFVRTHYIEPASKGRSNLNAVPLGEFCHYCHNDDGGRVYHAGSSR